MDQSSDSMKDQVTALMRVINAADKEPCKIVEGLYLGSIGAANNTEALRQLIITHILTVVSLRPVHASDFVHKVIPVVDIESTNIAQYFGECIDFIDEARGQGSGVLVHCFAGRSRSVTIVVAYLMKKNGMCLSEALDHVRSKRPQASPNAGFILQLQEFERSLQEMESKFTLEDIYKEMKKAAKCSRLSKAGPSKAIASKPRKRKRDSSDAPGAIEPNEPEGPTTEPPAQDVPSPYHIKGNPTMNDVSDILETSPDKRKKVRGKYKATAMAAERASDVLPIEFQLGPDWREVQDQKRHERNEKLARFGDDLIPREPGWLIHEDQNLMDEEDAKEMAPELWKGVTTARTMECCEHSYSDLGVASTRLAVLGSQVMVLSGWISRTIQAMGLAKTQAEQRATRAIAVVAKLIQRVYHYEQLLRASRTASVMALPGADVRDDLGPVEADQLAKAEAFFLSTLEAQRVEIRDTEQSLRDENEALKTKVRNFDVDFTNLKNHFDEDKKALNEKIEKLEAELTITKGYIPKFKEALTKAVGMAVDKFNLGFCLARKQIVDRNPNLDLSSVNGDEELPEDSSWCGKEFLYAPVPVTADDISGPSPH